MEATKIVGISASTCARFSQEIAENPVVERNYAAWAQGFMSGALMRAPKGVNEGLDHTPKTLGRIPEGFLRQKP